MASTETLIAFLLALAVFAYLPGPAILYTAAQTLARGRRAGLMAALGLHAGGYVHVLAAMLGLSALLNLVPVAFAVIKFAGAAYLIWVGIGMLRAQAPSDRLPQVAGKSGGRAFIDSMVVEIFNPKAALFFVSFLPQFVDPAAAWPVPAQFLALGVVTLIAFASADIVVVFAASGLVRQVRSGGLLQRTLNRVGGALLIALGLRLALEQQR